MQITEYFLLTTTDSTQLNRAAEARVAAGWQPLGAASCAGDQNRTVFCQAFIKYAEPKPGTTVTLLQDKALIGHCTVLENAEGRLVLDISHLG